MGVNSLPKNGLGSNRKLRIATASWLRSRQCRFCDLNPGHSVPESSTLTARLPSHPMLLRHLLYRYFTCVFLCLVVMMSGWCCEAVWWNQRGVYAGRRCYQDRVLSLCCWLRSCIACQCNSTRGHRVSPEVCMSATDIDTHTHTHTHLTTLCPGLPRWAGTRKVKPIWILLKQETVSGSGISWAICKSAHRSRQACKSVL